MSHKTLLFKVKMPGALGSRDASFRIDTARGEHWFNDNEVRGVTMLEVEAVDGAGRDAEVAAVDIAIDSIDGVRVVSLFGYAEVARALPPKYWSARGPFAVLGLRWQIGLAPALPASWSRYETLCTERAAAAPPSTWVKDCWLGERTLKRIAEASPKIFVAPIVSTPPPADDVPGLTVCVACECGRVAKQAVGKMSEREARCQHVFRYDVLAGARGALICTNCTIRVPIEILEKGMLDRTRPRHDRVRNEIADECQRLKDESTVVLAENARLRRELESLKRKRERR